MSTPPPQRNLIYYSVALVAAALIVVFVFLRNFRAGEEAAKLAPPPAEKTGAASKVVNEQALAKDVSLAGKGKALFETNCASCHGPKGNGDGPRAASINPKPRNYHTEQFKFGNDIVSIHNTLMRGSPGTSMPSFALLPLEDTWAIVHYVYTLLPSPPPITDAQVAALPGGSSGGTANASTPAAPAPSAIPAAPDSQRIPIEIAMQRIAREVVVPTTQQAPISDSRGATLYAQHCASCHGAAGEGMRQRVLSVPPYRYEVTGNLTTSTNPWTRDRNKFYQIVVQGLPGRIMPGQATLTSQEMDDLYAFVRGLAKTR
jgi:mono/diheme cytochrome c family protein